MRIVTLVLLFAAMGLRTEAHADVLSPGEPLTATFVERLIESRLAAGAGERLEIEIDAPRLPLGNQSMGATEITLHDLRLDERSGRLQAALVGVNGEGHHFSLPLRGRATPLVEVPVLNRALAPGELIGAADLDWQELPARRLPRQAVTDAAVLIGSEARRRLSPNRVLAARDVGQPLLVQRGRPVRLVFRAAGLDIATLGVAQDDGALDALVRVLNDDSRRQVQGLVSGPDQVTVQSNTPLAR